MEAPSFPRCGEGAAEKATDLCSEGATDAGLLGRCSARRFDARCPPTAMAFLTSGLACSSTAAAPSEDPHDRACRDKAQ
jgi:hypothetical protein